MATIVAQVSAPSLGVTSYNAVQTVGVQGIAGTESVSALLLDTNGNLVICTGITVPSNAQAGFAKGCIFLDTDVASGTGGMYLNKGTSASSIFTLVTQG